MEATNGRTVSYSRTEQVQILMQGTLNGYNRLFGGRLMEWIDVVAAVTARRHCGKNVTTAAVDSLVFKSPAMVNDTILLEGHVTFAGRTSMEVCVTTYVEELSGERHEINKAYLVLVAIDDDGKPSPVPPVIPESDEEKQEYEEAQRRRKNRDSRR
ncbi:MAG: acyl-CoA thioesterase [Eubacteriales bacterium]